MATTATRIDDNAIAKLTASIQRDVDSGLYDGAVVALAHRGEVVLEQAIGYSERDTGRVAKTDDVFRVLSLSKAFTVATVFQAIEDGLLALTTRVVDVIPEFRSADRFLNKRKDRISLYHLLTHRSAMPPTPEPVAMDKLGNLAYVIDAICKFDAIGEPGEVIDYSPAINHALMAEMVRRVRGEERFRTVVTRDILEPLGMTSTSLGIARHLADRVVPLKARFGDAGWLSGKDVEALNDTVDEEAELPWVGYVSTAGDVLRFAEMYRRGGEYEGTRIVHPPILERAFKNHTGERLNNWWIPMWQRRNWEPMPANLGMGVFLRGEGMHPSILGTLTSPGTYGNYGAGSSLYWVDPARELTFVCLTAGVLEESANIERFQRLSDMAVSTVTA